MTYEAVEVNHRSFIDVIEAVCVLDSRATLDIIAEYSDIANDSAQKALKMAMQLGFVQQESTLFKPIHPFARLFTDAKTNEKKAILKFKLMEYEPFKFFANLILKGQDETRASCKTQMVYNFSGSPMILRNTFLDLGIFSRIFVEKETGIETVFDAEPDIRNIFESISNTLNEEAQVENFISTQLDEDVLEYVRSFIDRLKTAALRISSNSKSCVKDTADVFEDFLKKICSEESVDITGANGIIEVGNRLKSASKITSKHQGFINFIGHMRNAFKHTTDSEINATWDVSSDLPLNLFLVTLTAMNSIFLCIKRTEYIL